ncbi:BON domain-containing protein [Micromonospora sp. KC606]|uniref:BON domain-containing protein n=1 Tax=Micromonospora sp. KC606 TaxID=2530379 RepID=UPI001FB60689|nr:BON domain-containing protein [Micromonospora sp. KC606]
MFPEDHGWTAGASRPTPADDDARIAAAVAQRLASDWTTRRQQITVSVQNQVVILAGIVSDPHARQAAAAVAWNVAGVLDVCNALRLPGIRPHR